jgi:ClpP class serine protease
MRTTPPSEYEAKGIVQIISEARSREEEEEETKKEAVTRTDIQIVSVEEEIQRRRRTSLSGVDINEEEIANKLKAAANEFKDLVFSGTKIAKQKHMKNKNRYTKDS